MNIVKISVTDTLALRQKLLRPYLSLEQCRLPEDEHDQAAHFGAYDDNSLVGICSIYPQSFPHSYAKTSWRVRMMAIEEDVRHRGFGKQLLTAAEHYASENGAEIFWCHARVAALSFYESQGYRIEGDMFELEDIGPHFFMRK